MLRMTVKYGINHSLIGICEGVGEKQRLNLAFGGGRHERLTDIGLLVSFAET